MRARFTHDGALDHHAHNEHELFRRADEALERQRRLDHSAMASQALPALAKPQTQSPLSQLTTRPEAPSSIASVAVPVTKFPGMQTMPHEQIALTHPHAGALSTPLSWPSRESETAAPSIGITSIRKR